MSILGNLQRDARRRIDEALAPRPAPVPHQTGAPTVAGLFRAASGIGESARLCHAALTDLGLAPDAIDLSESFGQAHLSEPAPPSGDNRGPIIIHLNPSELPRALRAIGALRLEGRKVIGYWAWELPRIPPSWRRAMAYVHEVWVPSAFCAEAFGANPARPVRTVPHVLPPTESARPRTNDHKPFTVLATGDLRSSLARKNLVGAVKSFRDAFADDSDKVLIVRATHRSGNDPAWRNLSEHTGGAANIRLDDRIRSRAEETALLASTDVVLSPHRAEGFGLVLARAMQLGIPVIATGWSGNMDFMTPQSACLLDYELVPVEDPQGIYTAPDQVWAEPNLVNARNWLVRLANDPALRDSIGVRALETYPSRNFRETLRTNLEYSDCVDA